MNKKIHFIDFIHGRVIMHDDLKHIFTVSNHNPPAPLFSDSNLMALAVYISWNSYIASYYSVSMQESASFRLWALGASLFPGDASGPLLPRAAIAATACFPEARELVEKGTQKSRYELCRWFFENLPTVFPGYSLPNWLRDNGEIPDISLGQEYYWRSLDEDFQKWMPIHQEAHHRLPYLGWLRKNQPDIFRLCADPHQTAARLDAPAARDTGEGITVLMEAWYEGTAVLHQMMRLDSPEGRLAYSSWFLRHQVPAYGVSAWTWDCLTATCHSASGKPALPKGVAGVFFSEQPSFRLWEQLPSSAQRDFLAIYMGEITPLLHDMELPPNCITVLSLPTGECQHAAEYGVGVLQQSLWEKASGNRLESREDCQACITWYIHTYAGTPLFPLTASWQIAAWVALHLVPQEDSSEGSPIFLRQRESTSVTVLGWPDGLLGIGADCRMTTAALGKAEVTVRQASVSHLLPFGGQAYPLAETPEREPHSLCSIFCLAAQDIYRLWLANSRDWWAGRHNIGLCPWELPHWPKSASFAVAMLDEIWAPSSFVANAFAECGKPVTYMPHAVIPPEPVGDLRAELGVSPETIVFLTAYDSNASCVRKNPLAVIRAFNQAFAGTRHDVKLIMKTMNAANHQAAWQELHDENRCGDKVVFIDEGYPAERHARLLNTCDAFVSLHRSEGFGRLLAEAMSLGKLLIASDFGGNTDFTTTDTACPVKGTLVPVGRCSYILTEGQSWFDADTEHATDSMLHFIQSPDAFSERRLKGQQKILEQNSLEAVGERARRILVERGLILA